MKKPSRSLMPEGFKTVDDQKTVLNGIHVDGTIDNQEIVDAVSKILEEYKKSEEKTETERNNLLVKFTADEFGEILKSYVDDYAKTINLSKVVKEALSDSKVQNSVKTTIETQIRTLVRKLQSNKAKSKAKSKTTSVDAISEDTQTSDDQKNTEKLREKLIQDNLDDIFDDIRKSKNPNLQDYRGEIKKINDRHTESVIKLYRKSCKDFADKIKTQKSETRLGTSVIKSTAGITKKDIKEQKKGNGIIDVQKLLDDNKKKTKKQQIEHNNLVISSINVLAKIIRKNDIEWIEEQQGEVLKKRFKPYGIIEKKLTLSQLIKKVFARFTKKLLGIIGPFLNLYKIGGMIPGPIMTNFRTYKRRLVKTLKFFKIDKMMKKVLGIFSTMGKLVAVALKNTFFSFMMTKTGAYTIGFIAGFIFTRLKNLITGKQKSEGFDKLKEKLSKAWHVFTVIWDVVVSLVKFVSQKIIIPIFNFLKKIYKPAKSLITSILDFAHGDGLISRLLFGMIPMAEALMRNIITLRAFKAAPDFLSGLVASAIVFTIESIKSFVVNRKGQSFNMLQGKSEIYQRYDTTPDHALANMSKDDVSKYNAIIERFDDEQYSLANIVSNVDLIKQTWGEGSRNKGDKLDLWLELPELMDDIFSSKLFGVDKEAKNYLQKKYHDKTVKEQIEAISSYLNVRYDKLISLRASFSNVSSAKELEDRMRRLGEVDVKSGSVTLSDYTTDTLQSMFGTGYEDNRGYMSFLHYDTGDTVDDIKQRNSTTRIASRRLVDLRGRMTKKENYDDYDEVHYEPKIKSIAKDGNHALEEMDEQKKLGGRGASYVRSTVDYVKLTKMTVQQQKEEFKRLLEEYEKKLNEYKLRKTKDKEENQKSELQKLNEDTQETYKEIEKQEKKLKEYEDATGKKIK